MRTLLWGTPMASAMGRKCSMTWVETRMLTTSFSSTPREPDLRLEKGVLLERGAKGVLDDDVGRGEPCLDIALHDPALRDDVVGPGDDGGPGLHRLHRVVDPGNGLELDLDQLHGVVRNVAGLGRDQGKGLAEVPDPLPDQDRQPGVQALLAGLSRDVGRGGAVGEVRGGENARDSFERTGLGDVEAREPGARDIRADHPHVQHVRHHVVAGVGGAARDLAGSVDAGQRPPDLPEPDVGSRRKFARDAAHRPLLPASATVGIVPS